MNSLQSLVPMVTYGYKWIKFDGKKKKEMWIFVSHILLIAPELCDTFHLNKGWILTFLLQQR